MIDKKTKTTMKHMSDHGYMPIAQNFNMRFTRFAGLISQLIGKEIDVPNKFEHLEAYSQPRVDENFDILLDALQEHVDNANNQET